MHCIIICHIELDTRGYNKLWVSEKMRMDIIYSKRYNVGMEEFPYWVRKGDPIIFNICIIPLFSIQECSLLIHAPVIFIMSCQPKVQQIIYLKCNRVPYEYKSPIENTMRTSREASPHPKNFSSCMLFCIFS